MFLTLAVMLNEEIVLNVIIPEFEARQSDKENDSSSVCGRVKRLLIKVMCGRKHVWCL